MHPAARPGDEEQQRTPGEKGRTMEGAESRWAKLKDALRSRLSSQAYATWVSQMTLVQDTGPQLVLSLPNLFSLDWVNNHYRDVLEHELRQLDPGAELELRFDASAETTALPIPEPITDPEDGIVLTQPPLRNPAPSYSGGAGPRIAPSQVKAPPPIPSSPVHDRYTFESFVTGPSNQLACAAALSVAENPGSAYNPLFIFGRVGLGKTHLIQAIGHAIRKRNPAAIIRYQSTETFINDVVQGIRFERMDQIRRAYREPDCLLIDDIQFISGKEACQAEFFHTFNALHDAGKQVCITSDKLPHEIKDLEERVRTRFQWGLIVDLQPPELETRCAIVRKKAESEGIQIDDDVAMCIAQMIKSNVRELEGSIIRVSAFASLSKQPITIELVKSVLRDVMAANSRPLTCERIVQTVSDHFQVKVADLKSAKRGRSIALPRQISMYLCRKLTDASYPEIGTALGGKDHTTALNAFNRIRDRLEEPDIREHVESLERTLTE